MSRAVIYARASLDTTGEGRSVERQTDACKALCTARGWDVIDVVSDNSISAYGEKRRPGWLRVLGMIEHAEVDCVVAWHMDRMTRSMVDLEHLISLTEQANVGIATATGDIDLSSDTGRMLARILAAVARAEVERKAARQKLANRQLAESGKPWSGGARPFGYTDDQLDIVPAEAEAIEWAAYAVLDGASLGSIAREWADRGLASSRAAHAKGSWTPRGVKAVLVSPRYAGIRSYLGKPIGPGTWPAIIDMATHEALAQKLSAPSRRLTYGPGGKTVRNLMTHLAVCDQCETPVRGSAVQKRLTYACPSGHVNVPRPELDRYVLEAMAGRLRDPRFLAGLVENEQGDAVELQAELDTLQSRRRLLAVGVADGTVDEATFVEVGASLRDRMVQIEGELKLLTSGSALVGLDVGTEAVASQWEALPMLRQRRVIERFLDVRLVQKERRNYEWTPEKYVRVSAKQTSPALT